MPFAIVLSQIFPTSHRAYKVPSTAQTSTSIFLSLQGSNLSLLMVPWETGWGDRAGLVHAFNLRVLPPPRLRIPICLPARFTELHSSHPWLSNISLRFSDLCCFHAGLQELSWVQQHCIYNTNSCWEKFSFYLSKNKAVQSSLCTLIESLKNDIQKPLMTATNRCNRELNTTDTHIYLALFDPKVILLKPEVENPYVASIHLAVNLYSSHLKRNKPRYILRDFCELVSR